MNTTQHIDPHHFTLGPVQQAWLAALRSGEFKQGKGQLGNEYRKEYCCLGVACKVGIIPFFIKDSRIRIRSFTGINYESCDLSFSNYRLLGLHNSEGVFSFIDKNQEERFREHVTVGFKALTNLNDRGWTFSQIADLIEAWPSVIFSRPV